MPSGLAWCHRLGRAGLRNRRSDWWRRSRLGVGAGGKQSGDCEQDGMTAHVRGTPPKSGPLLAMVLALGNEAAPPFVEIFGSG